MKFLHIIPPEAVDAEMIVRFIRSNFPEEEHAVLIMQTRNWVIYNCPRLLAFLDMHYLPETNKSVFSKLNRLKSTMRLMDDAEHIVLHSIHSIHGSLFLPAFCRKKYAEKCIWIETYSDMLRWKQPGDKWKTRMRNRLLGDFLRNIPLVGAPLLSDKAMYDQHIKGNAQFFLTPYPTLKTEDIRLATEGLRHQKLPVNGQQLSSFEKLYAYCERRFTKRIAAEQKHGKPKAGAVETAPAQLRRACDKNGRPYMLMVEGDMFAGHNHFSFFQKLKRLTDEGLIVANLNHVGHQSGKYCYTGDVPYRRMMRKAGKGILKNKYTDFLKPRSSKAYFYQCLSGVDAIAFMGQRTMNLNFIWLMLMMNKKVFIVATSPLYRYLKQNNVPVFPYHFLEDMTLEQLARPVRTDNCPWVRTFTEETNMVTCWRRLFAFAQQQRKEGEH